MFCIRDLWKQSLIQIPCSEKSSSYHVRAEFGGLGSLSSAHWESSDWPSKPRSQSVSILNLLPMGFQAPESLRYTQSNFSHLKIPIPVPGCCSAHFRDSRDSNLSFWAKLEKQYSLRACCIPDGDVFERRNHSAWNQFKFHSYVIAVGGLLQLYSCNCYGVDFYKAASSVKRTLCFFFPVFAKDFFLDNLINIFKKTYKWSL